MTPAYKDALVKALAEKLDAFVKVVPTTPRELHEYYQDYYGYVFPDQAVCAGHCSPFDALADAFFSTEGGESIWVGPRTGGKTLSAAVLEHSLMTLFGDTVAHAGAIDAQAMKCYEYLKRFFSLRWFANDVMGESLMSSTQLKNGAKVEVLPMTEKRLNSPHVRVFFADEIELTTNKLIAEAMGIPMRVNGRAPLSIYTSSRKKAHGPMEEMLKTSRAAGRKIWTWCCPGDTLVDTVTGEREIQTIKKGDRVWGYEAGRFIPRRVTWAGKTGHRDTVLVTFEDGRTLRCTPDHEIRTETAWKAAGLLKPGESVLSRVQGANSRTQHFASMPAVSGGVSAGELGVDLPDLQRCEARNRAAVLGMSGESPRTARTIAQDRVSMRLRQSEAPAIESLRAVSIGRRSGNEQGAGVGTSGVAGAQTHRNGTDAGRDCSCAITQDARHFGRATGSRRIVARRFSATRVEDGGRGSRILPRTAHRAGPRHPANRTFECARVFRADPVGFGDGSLGAPTAGRVRVASVARAAAVDVYDITVSEVHNFLANGIVVHNCAFEIIETCPPERHRNGAKTGCGSCALEPVCREKKQGLHSADLEYVPGPGRAARSHGWMKIDDLILKYKTIEEGVFKSQWLSLRPETKGLAYPMFDENVHVIDYEYNPALPVVAGIDFGYTNPSAAIYLQPLPNDDVVVFAEDYGPGRTADELADSMMREPWYRNTNWRVGDSAAAGDRATLNKRGVSNEASDKSGTDENKSSIVAGINLVRYLLNPMGRPTPILYFARQCENTIGEILTYHHPEEKEDRNVDEVPVKSKNHAMDALRYAARRLYRGSVSAG